MDVKIQNEGGVFLFDLITDAAREWVGEHIPESALYFGGALVVEHRYALDIATGMENDGLEVE